MGAALSFSLFFLTLFLSLFLFFLSFPLSFSFSSFSRFPLVGLRIGVLELLRPCSLGDPLTGEGAHVRSGSSPPNLIPNCWVEGSFAAAASVVEGREDERWWWEEGKERGVGVWVCVGWWVLRGWRGGEKGRRRRVSVVFCASCAGPVFRAGAKPHCFMPGSSENQCSLVFQMNLGGETAMLLRREKVGSRVVGSSD